MADDTFTQDQDDTTTTFPRQNHNLLNLTNDTSTGVSPLEQEVLDEYTRLLSNMNQVGDRYLHTIMLTLHYPYSSTSRSALTRSSSRRH